MSEFREENINDSQPVTGTPRWLTIAVIVLAAFSIGALGLAWSASNHASYVEQTTNAALKENVEVLNQRIAKADDTNTQIRSDLRVVTDKLKLTETQLLAARHQTKVSSANYIKKLNGLETSLAAKASAEDINKLNGDVSGVKNALDATRTSVETSIQMARGELGTLIARNHDEIDQLRRMGQREYFEFTLARKGGIQKVGNIQVELRDTNPKKNRFTIVVLADDNRFEKKNRSVNEPIYFYTNGSRTALELVVNKVSKQQASGYLSVPKSAATTAAVASSSGW
ncbi:MAG TPA: hypothetical protein VOA41_14235 [Candidatus Dormibacteraeota bacterium]|nr:hypothetical protein [Candidatus Dormibacteraeota bacterium]